LVKIDWTGKAVTVISGDSFAANRHRVAWQTETLSDPRKRMQFCNALITKKIEGCVLTLEKSLRRSAAWERAMERAYADLSRLELDPPKDIDTLRTLEANSAAAYFRAWKGDATSMEGVSASSNPCGLAFRWLAQVPVQSSRQSKRLASRERDLELRLRDASKRSANQNGDGRL
jgi:CRISPR-associated protein Cas1